MKKTEEKNNEEIPKKHNKRKIKISKVKKFKPNLLFPVVRFSRPVLFRRSFVSHFSFLCSFVFASHISRVSGLSLHSAFEAF